MWHYFLSKDGKRKHALANASSEVMRDYLSVPFPEKNTPLNALDIVALDLETTGLDPVKDRILSIGLVEIKQSSIRLNTSWHKIVKVRKDIPESSAIVHHITDDQSAAGQPLEEILPDLLQRLAGKVMLVHYANIEQNFLNAACMGIYGSPFLISTIDTLPLGKRLLELRNHTIQPGNLRLFNLRPLFGLPMYKAHNAFYDALATAELFLAMTAELAPKSNLTLKNVMN